MIRRLGWSGALLGAGAGGGERASAVEEEAGNVGHVAGGARGGRVAMFGIAFGMTGGFVPVGRALRIAHN